MATGFESVPLPGVFLQMLADLNSASAVLTRTVRQAHAHSLFFLPQVRGLSHVTKPSQQLSRASQPYCPYFRDKNLRLPKLTQVTWPGLGH